MKVLLLAAMASSAAYAGNVRIEAVPGASICMPLEEFKSCIFVDSAGTVWVEDHIRDQIEWSTTAENVQYFSVYDSSNASAMARGPSRRDPGAGRPAPVRRDPPRRDPPERRDPPSSPVIDIDVGDIGINIGSGNGGGGNSCTECHADDHHERNKPKP